MIKDNWKHVQEVEKQVREATGDPEARINKSLFFFKGRQLLIPVEYNKPTRNGYQKKVSIKLVRANYCPFSGLPLHDDID